MPSFEVRQKEYAVNLQKHFYFMTLSSNEVSTWHSIVKLFATDLIHLMFLQIMVQTISLKAKRFYNSQNMMRGGFEIFFILGLISKCLELLLADY